MKKLDEKDEQLRRLEGIIQAKDTIIADMQRDINEYKKEVGEINLKLNDSGSSLNYTEERHSKELDKYKRLLETKENMVYISTQWGNNIIYVPNLSGGLIVKTDTQWGSNFKIVSMPFFKTSEDKMADKINESIVKKLRGTSMETAREYNWGLVKINT